MKIEFITENQGAFDLFPPIPAKKMIPEWYKDMSLTMEGIIENDAKTILESGSSTYYTIKGCVPVLDYLTNGYIIRANADIAITPDINEDRKGYWWKSNGTKIEAHGHSQCPVKMNNYKNDYFKILNPFGIKTPKGYSCYFYQPEFFLEGKFRLFPAIVDTDEYHMPVNFPGVILSDERFMIKAGDPIMVVFPFKRDDWQAEIKMDNGTIPKMQNIFNAYLSRMYKKVFHKKKNFD